MASHSYSLELQSGLEYACRVKSTSKIRVKCCMAELKEPSTSASDAQRTSQQSNRPTRWTAPCSRDDRFTSLFSDRLSLVCTRAISETGAAPFFTMSLGVGGFSWPFRLAIKNHFFMRFFKGATPQCGRVLCNKSRSVHQECIGPSPENAEAYLSDLSVDYDYGDQQLCACHKHIREQDRNGGGTDTKEGEETFDGSKDSGQALSVHLSEDSDTGEHDLEEEEDDKWDYFDPIQPADLGLKESGSVFSTLIDNNDDNDFIVFSDNPEAVDTKPVCNRAGEDVPHQSRSLVHTVSYSSDESGFCENITDSSDEECEDNESEDHEVGVVSPELFIENTTVATNRVHQVQKNTCIFDSMGDSKTCNKKDTVTVSDTRFVPLSTST